MDPKIHIDMIEATATNPLPHNDSALKTKFCTSIKSITAPHVPSCHPAPKKRPRRNGTASFNIFIDDKLTDIPPLKKIPRKDGRSALGNRTHTENNIPSSRAASTPYTLQTDDPYWENFENFYPFAGIRPTRNPLHNTAQNTNYTSNASGTTPQDPCGAPKASATPLQAPDPNLRQTLPNNSATPKTIRSSCTHLPRPKNKILYVLLEIRNWRASEADIRAAYKKVVLRYHPDKVAENERNIANQMTARINAARDVLLGLKSRRRYHITGNLPF